MIRNSFPLVSEHNYYYLKIFFKCNQTKTHKTKNNLDAGPNNNMSGSCLASCSMEKIGKKSKKSLELDQDLKYDPMPKNSLINFRKAGMSPNPKSNASLTTPFRTPTTKKSPSTKTPIRSAASIKITHRPLQLKSFPWSRKSQSTTVTIPFILGRVNLSNFKKILEENGSR